MYIKKYFDFNTENSFTITVPLAKKQQMKKLVQVLGQSYFKRTPILKSL
jgi:hypothetical protein